MRSGAGGGAQKLYSIEKKYPTNLNIEKNYNKK